MDDGAGEERKEAVEKVAIDDAGPTSALPADPDVSTANPRMVEKVSSVPMVICDSRGLTVEPELVLST